MGLQPVAQVSHFARRLKKGLFHKRCRDYLSPTSEFVRNESGCANTIQEKWYAPILTPLRGGPPPIWGACDKTLDN
jgi:hypothetical protein